MGLLFFLIYESKQRRREINKSVVEHQNSNENHLDSEREREREKSLVKKRGNRIMKKINYSLADG